MATVAMAPAEKKAEHESGYYEGSDRESCSMEYSCPSPVNSRYSSQSLKLNGRKAGHKSKKSHAKIPKFDKPDKGINGFSYPSTRLMTDKSVEIVEDRDAGPDVMATQELSPGNEDRNGDLSSSVELIGGTIPIPVKDSVDWNLVEASKIRRKSKSKFGTHFIFISCILTIIVIF